MVNPERQPLAGAVEADECDVGGPEAGRRGGRQPGAKTLVAVAVEVRGAGSGRLRTQTVGDASAATLCGFVRAVVAPGATVHTDGWRSYQRLATLGYRHEPRTQHVQRRRSAHPDEILPRVHRVIGNLEGWLHGTHHGVSAEHLPAYLDEYVFRFNRRRTPMAAFRTLLGLGSQRPPTSYGQIVAPTRLPERTG